MDEIYQRVVDLDKIDSKEMAYIAGYQTRVWWKDHYGYNRGMEFLSKNQIVLECPFKNYFHKKWLEFICMNFRLSKNEVHYRQQTIDNWMKRGIKISDIIGNEGYERACAEHVIYLNISEESKSHIGNKLPICKCELKPYLYMGFFHSSGHIVKNNQVCFINSKAAIKAFKHQLEQWYEFNEYDFERAYQKPEWDEEQNMMITAIKQIKETPIYMLTMTEEASKKFFAILPDDYKQYFGIKTTYFNSK